MSATDAAAPAPAEPAPEAPAPHQPLDDTPEPSAPTEPEAAVSNGDAAPATEGPKKRGRKRKVSVAEEKPAASETAETEAGGAAVDEVTTAKTVKDKKPAAKKPKTKPASPAAAPKKKLGRPRKTPVKEESEDEDEIETELHRRVEALPDDVKSKFGTIVWAKMVGFPFWPALITDPRLLPHKLQVGALKELETKYFVCFYQTRDFSSVLFKNIEAWDDTKHDYRSGHPTKDAKAPKRRSQLMAAIELADKDALLPVEDRMDGLMKVVPEEQEADSATEDEKPAVPKRKVGRPVGSKNKPKPGAEATDSPSPAPKAKRGRKKSTDTENGAAEAEKMVVPESPEEVQTPPLSKDEIKAKVASRKSPSKKKAQTGEEKSTAATAKKAAKTSTKNESAAKGEMDSKRKKEIELVVPRKSVKSSDIREATEEAAQKKAAPREKAKDKGNYKVGNLAQFAGKMNRLHTNESSKNNDELIVLLTKLFEEKMVYKTDMERSGVAAVIAQLRKSTNPTVARTASAVRKHLINVLHNDDAEDAAPPASKKQKADGTVYTKPTKKQKSSVADAALTDTAVTPPASAPVESNGQAAANVSSDAKPDAVEVKTDEETPVDENKPSTEQTPTLSEEPAAPIPQALEVTKVVPAKPEPAELATPASPVKLDVVTEAFVPKPDPDGDKARMVCIDMLKKALAPIGERSAEIAREIEAQVFERFSESVDEYRTCARSITFGLKKNEKVRDRLKNGDLHALELAYSHEEILGA